jgi:hypothetical protein
VDDELPDYIMVMVANDRTKVGHQKRPKNWWSWTRVWTVRFHIMVMVANDRTKVPVINQSCRPRFGQSATKKGQKTLVELDSCVDGELPTVHHGHGGQ